MATGAESKALDVSGGPATGTIPPASRLYDYRGVISNEPGLLAQVKLS
jgi:hypothetical protein